MICYIQIRSTIGEKMPSSNSLVISNKQNKMIVFEFAYSECIYESGCVTHSIHKTRKGAEIALTFHKDKMRKEWLDMWNETERKRFPFGDMENWIIKETEVQE